MIKIWKSLRDRTAGRYKYVPGHSNIGIGAENLALVQPGRAIDQDIYSPRYNVRGSFNVLGGAPAFQVAPAVPDYDLKANGVYLSGTFALQSLTDNWNKENGNG